MMFGLSTTGQTFNFFTASVTGSSSGTGSGTTGDVSQDSYVNAVFAPSVSLLKLERASGSNTEVKVVTVNDFNVEMNVTNQPVSNLQAVDDWAAI